MTDDVTSLEQAAYERRMADVCSIIILHALITDSDHESRALDLPERIRLANEYAQEWAASRGHVSRGETNP